MSLIDASNRFCNDQAVTAAAASESQIDLKAAARDVGNGNPLYLCIACTVAMEGSSVTNVVTLRQSAAANMGSPDTLATVCTFPATSPAGTRKVYAVPPSLITKEYLDLYFTPTGGAGSLSAGSFTAFLTPEYGVAKNYADNVDFNLLGL